MYKTDFLVVIQRKKNKAEYQHECWCNFLIVPEFLKTEVYLLSLHSLWLIFRYIYQSTSWSYKTWELIFKEDTLRETKKHQFYVSKDKSLNEALE